jgi:hypothetical protein
LPFVVSRDGKVVAKYRFGNWTGGPGPDLIYQSEGTAGFLRNKGVGAGWDPDSDHAPPIQLDARSYLIDLNCDGGAPSLIGVGPDATGKLTWQVYRYTAAKWEEDKRPNYQPLFPPDTNPEAVRQVKISSARGSCPGFVVATAAGGGFHKTIIASPTGWKEVPNKVPKFDFVDADGNSSAAIIADLKGDGQDDVIANRELGGGKHIAFAYVQTNTTFDREDRFSSRS